MAYTVLIFALILPHTNQQKFYICCGSKNLYSYVHTFLGQYRKNQDTLIEQSSIQLKLVNSQDITLFSHIIVASDLEIP